MVVGEGECVGGESLDNVKDKLGDVYVEWVGVGGDNVVEGLGMEERGGKGDRGLVLGGKLCVLEVIEKGRYVRFEVLEEVCVMGLERVYVGEGIGCLRWMNDKREIVVVGG